MDKYTILRQYFGHNIFRGGQEQLIDSILDGRDVLGIMPTGGGKSMCYQIPALMLPGVTVVISPLISLMMDQVMALKASGVPAAYINSTLTESQIRTAYRRMREGAYKIIYVAPERLSGQGFLSAMQQLQPSLVAVDEAHCISQWGQDFRPSYLRIVEFLQQLPMRPVVAAFTATATEDVREDIIRILQLQSPKRVITGFDRSNLYFEVLTPSDKNAQLRRLLDQRQGRTGIVYCSTRAKAEQVCTLINNWGYAATRYHAGLSDEERQTNQDDFQYDRVQIMVATNAFGMGIDKSNVSFVIHYNMPKSVEAYYQEAGRAGRDGEPADCILLFGQGDVHTARYLIENSSAPEQMSAETVLALRRRDYLRLEYMVAYCTTERCLRGYLLDYFGETHEAQCGKCSNCSIPTELVDVTDTARCILSAVHQVQRQLHYNVGMVLLCNVLRGSRASRILALHLDGLDCYGALRERSEEELKQIITALRRYGYLQQATGIGALELTAAAEAVTRGGERVTMSIKRREAEPEPPPTRGAKPSEALLRLLKAERKRIAQERHIPPYTVFSNATLVDMARRLPRNAEQLRSVSGVGEWKAANYGMRFLQVILNYLDV